MPLGEARRSSSFPHAEHPIVRDVDKERADHHGLGNDEVSTVRTIFETPGYLSSALSLSPLFFIFL